MFIQVIQGRVGDQAGLQRCLDRWNDDLAAGAAGYLGSTSGTCADGTFICLVRFASPDAARRNAERPEQGAWWAAAERCFDGQVTVMDCAEVTEWMGGGSDTAGFVQVLEGHTSDPHRMVDLMSRVGDRVHDLRPEIVGGTLCSDGGDGYVEAVYFTSESAARLHESVEVPDDLRSLFEEETELMGEVSYYDMRAPMLVSARGTR
ncbi:hypothetical protein ACFWPA_17670 [Rhodococcus sp. NPDC058505]|uniref:hypothetical protein n=1 Tax=unclassified Rhodococcus (in: high G+C Gram-positive bacteria) TaxID=192944 RepID=UPI0036626106